MSMPVYKKRTGDRAVILLLYCEFVPETAATDESLFMNSEKCVPAEELVPPLLND